MTHSERTVLQVTYLVLQVTHSFRTSRENHYKNQVRENDFVSRRTPGGVVAMNFKGVFGQLHNHGMRSLMHALTRDDMDCEFSALPKSLCAHCLGTPVEKKGTRHRYFIATLALEDDVAACGDLILASPAPTWCGSRYDGQRRSGDANFDHA